jgi:hypothetical protein
MSVGCEQRPPQASTPFNLSSIRPAAETVVQNRPPAGPTKPLGEWIAWSVADTGFGPITIGMTPQQANDAVARTLQVPTGLTDEACDYASPRGIDSLDFMIEGGRIVRIDVYRHDIRTVQGAGVGDTEDRIQEIYSGHVQVTPHSYTDGHYLTVIPADTVAHPYLFVFETDGKVVTTFRAGILPQVKYIEGCS